MYLVFYRFPIVIPFESFFMKWKYNFLLLCKLHLRCFLSRKQKAMSTHACISIKSIFNISVALLLWKSLWFYVVHDHCCSCCCLLILLIRWYSQVFMWRFSLCCEHVGYSVFLHVMSGTWMFWWKSYVY